MIAQSSSRRGLSRSISLLVCASFFLTPAAHVARAQQQAQDDQDVAKAARQERARKAAQQKAAHVYTNDDLKQTEILTGEDRARVEARKNDPNNPASKPVMPSFDAENSPAPESLGEVARRIRKDVAARQAEEAAKSLSPLFPIELGQPVFAVPVEPAEPNVPMRSLPWRNPRPVEKASATHAAPTAPRAAARRDPFATPGGSLGPDELAPARPETNFEIAAPRTPAAHAPNEGATANLHWNGTARVAPSSAVRVAPVAPKLVLPRLKAAPSLGRLELPEAPARTAVETASVNPQVKRNFATSGPSAPKAPRAAPVSPKWMGPMPGRAPVLGAPETPAAPSRPFSESVRRPAPPRSHASPGSASPEWISPAAPKPPVLAPNVAPAAPLVSVPVLPRTAPRTPIDAADTLVVRGGDSLWRLARRIFGNGNRWNELAARNPAITNPDHIVPGTVLAIPAIDQRDPGDNGNRVPVRAGDSLWKLAAFYLGRGTAWNCIAEANPQVKDADRIYPGETLTMPDSCKERAARR